MKKLFLLGFLALTLSLTACSSKDPGEEQTAPQTTARETTMQTQAAEPSAEPKSGYEDQLALIADCRGLWIRSDPKVYYNYAVTDLDQNGRLELIVTACMGDDQISVTEVWEVNEDGTELTYAAWDQEDTSIADLTMESARAFYDASSDTYTYILFDTKPDSSGRLVTEKRGCTLKQHTITETTLCSKAGEKYYDVEGGEITQEEYEHMEDTVYAGQRSLTADFLWQAPFHDEIEVLSREDWYHMLEDSWQAFQLY